MSRQSYPKPNSWSNRCLLCNCPFAGVSTFIGILPVSFSNSETFMTVFIIFCGLIVLGVLHGLMFIPCILRFIGTRDTILHHGFDGSSKEGTIDSDDLSQSSSSQSREVSDKSVSSCGDVTSPDELVRAPSSKSVSTTAVNAAQSAESGQEEPPIVPSRSEISTPCSFLEDVASESRSTAKGEKNIPSYSVDEEDGCIENVETVMVRGTSQLSTKSMKGYGEDDESVQFGRDLSRLSRTLSNISRLRSYRSEKSEIRLTNTFA